MAEDKKNPDPNQDAEALEEALAAAEDSAAELEAVQKKCLELYLPV